MLVALIREAECIGCAKCIPACPVDAIIGTSQFLHNVLIDECIGCGLCVAPCPMDCIEMIESGIINGSEQKEQRAYRAKQRYQARQKRLALNEAPKLLAPFDEKTKVKIQQEIKASILRVTEKRDQNEHHKKT